MADLAARDPDAAARVLAAAARAFDPGLRAAARSLAARLPLGKPRSGTPDRPGTSRVVTRREPTGSDVDLDATLAAMTGKVTVGDGVARPVEDVVADIWRRAGEELGKG